MNLTTPLRCGLLATSLALLASAPASATVLFSDNFNSPDDTVLAGTPGWSRTTSYPGGVSDQPITVQGGQAVLQAQTSGPGEFVLADAGQSYGLGTQFYVGFDFTANNLNSMHFLSQLTGDTSGVGAAAAFFYLNSISADSFTAGLYVSSTTGGLEGAATYSIGQTYRVVIEYINSSAPNYGDTTKLYINGSLIVSSTTTISDDGDLAESRYFVLRQENSSGDYSVGFDNLVIATTFSEASTAAVPEPSTYAAVLGGVTLAGVALRRRRRVTVASQV